MKSFLLSISILLSGIFSVSAQSSIVDALEEAVPYEGIIKVNASYEINQLIGKKNEALLSGEVDYVKTSGYRVQIFSGNEQRTSKAEAFKKESLINDAFSDVPTYVTYKAPYWRVRVGDFRTHEEAFLLMKQIGQDLPSLKKEMYIVKDEVKIPVNP